MKKIIKFIICSSFISLSSCFSYENLTFAEVINYNWNTEFDDNIEVVRKYKSDNSGWDGGTYYYIVNASLDDNEKMYDLFFKEKNDTFENLMLENYKKINVNILNEDVLNFNKEYQYFYKFRGEGKGNFYTDFDNIYSPTGHMRDSLYIVSYLDNPNTLYIIEDC